MENKTFSLIPYPHSIQLQPGSLELIDSLEIFYHPYFQNEINIFRKQVGSLIATNITYIKEEACLFLRQTEAEEIPAGSYQLVITPSQIQLAARERSSLFAGLQTLLQLLLAGSDAGHPPLQIQCMQILDQPNYSWRGFMLDEARHFQGADTVKLILDWMAYLKMNVFHWHLSDDQGFRVESKRFPLLTEVGAYRPATQRGGMLSRKVNMQSHQGFYTQAEISELVQYAAARHIEVIPEIDVPGHSSAILAAYPNLGCRGDDYVVQPYWGIHNDILCVGQKSTIDFLEQLYGELLDIFPGSYFHSGGDEAPKKRWRRCPHCQERAQQLGYVKVEQLQIYLANQLNRFLQSQGRTMIAWNEVLAPDLDPEIIVHYWLGNKKTLQQHAQQGRRIILSNYDTYYLDHTYTHSSLEKVYSFDPLFGDLKDNVASILGIEAPLWSEFVPTRARLDWQLFPRLLAVAESAWLGDNRPGYTHFLPRLTRMLPQLEQAGIGYARLDQVDPSAWRRLGGGISLIQEGKRVAEEE